MRFDVTLRLHHPQWDVFETGMIANIVDKQHAYRIAIVRFGDGAKAFLAGSVPELQFDACAVGHFDDACKEVDTDGWIGELQF